MIAATNKNLEQLVREGKFRDDLYFRLNVVRITMPPLRERKEDIPILVRGFLAPFLQGKRQASSRSDSRRDGRASGLRLAGQRSRAAHRDRTRRRDGHRAKDYIARFADGRATGSPSKIAGWSFNSSFLGKDESARSARDRKKIDRPGACATNGNVTAAAKKLGISRRTLHRKINEMNAAETGSGNQG